MNRYNITVTFFDEDEFRFMAMGDSFMDAQWKVFGDKQLAQFIGIRKIRSILMELAEEDIDISFWNRRSENSEKSISK